MESHWRCSSASISSYNKIRVEKYFMHPKWFPSTWAWSNILLRKYDSSIYRITKHFETWVLFKPNTLNDWYPLIDSFVCHDCYWSTVVWWCNQVGQLWFFHSFSFARRVAFPVRGISLLTRFINIQRAQLFPIAEEFSLV